MEAVTARLEQQAAQIQKVSAQLEAEQTYVASRQQSVKAAPAPTKQQHFAISRHVSPRGGFVFSSLRLFELARVLVRSEFYEQLYPFMKNASGALIIRLAISTNTSRLQVTNRNPT